MKTTTAMATIKLKKREKGATLVALLAIMTIMAITMLAVAPSIVQEVQREKELEAIARGEEVAEAIKQYVSVLNKLPNSMDDLLEGLPQGTKKRQILRKSASIDPLSDDGKWRLVKPNAKTFINFARRVQNYNGGVLPNNPEPQRIFSNFSIAIVNSINTKSEEEIKDVDSSEDVDDQTEGVQFIGVISKSKSQSVVAYYGLENHSKWMFTPMFRGQGASAIQTGAGGGAFGTSSNTSKEPN
jgi:type II secretory pathway pseudopilin PulG